MNEMILKNIEAEEQALREKIMAEAQALIESLQYTIEKMHAKSQPPRDGVVKGYNRIDLDCARLFLLTETKKLITR